MPDINYFTDINMNNCELKSSRLENVGSLPSTNSNEVGRVLHLVSGKPMWSDGTQWKEFGSSGQILPEKVVYVSPSFPNTYPFYTSIQTAVTACPEGGLVYVYPGSYSEVITTDRSIHMCKGVTVTAVTTGPVISIQATVVPLSLTGEAKIVNANNGYCISTSGSLDIDVQCFWMEGAGLLINGGYNVNFDIGCGGIYVGSNAGASNACNIRGRGRYCWINYATSYQITSDIYVDKLANCIFTTLTGTHSINASFMQINGVNAGVGDVTFNGNRCLISGSPINGAMGSKVAIHAAVLIGELMAYGGTRISITAGLWENATASLMGYAGLNISNTRMTVLPNATAGIMMSNLNSSYGFLNVENSTIYCDSSTNYSILCNIPGGNQGVFLLDSSVNKPTFGVVNVITTNSGFKVHNGNRM